MSETLTTNMEIISLIRGIPCDISIPELREKASASIRVLLEKYDISNYPLLHKEIRELEKDCERLYGSPSALIKVFWFLHIYLCFYAHPETPLHPKTPSEKGFLMYLMYLYQKAKLES